jgi:hypothetical protein
MTPTPTGQVIPTAVGRDLVLERVLPGAIDDAWASVPPSSAWSIAPGCWRTRVERPKQWLPRLR